MDVLKEWIVPYSISNIVFAMMVILVFYKPMWVRIFLALFFAGAAFFNGYTALYHPEAYLSYSKLSPLPLYHNFIDGFFSEHVTAFVFTIAVGQLLIGTGLLMNDKWVKYACIGGIIFGLAIAPLGVGSAFPSTVIMAIAFFILSRFTAHDYIWKLKQYQQANAGMPGRFY